jgi:hypothetical protein
MPPPPLTRLRKLCLALDDATEKASWGEPTFRVNNKVFAMFASAKNHHGKGRDSVWLNSDALSQALLIKKNPKRFFSPPYAGPYGWIGVRLDGRVNWKELTILIEGAYEMTAAKGKKRSGARRKAR